MKQHSTPQIGNAGRSRTLQALSLANLLSLSVTLVMQAVLCRYMTTSEYGTYSQVLYVYNTLLAVFSLGLPKAYSYYLARVSPEEGRDVVRKLNGLFLLLASVFFVHFALAGRRHSRSARQSAAGRAVEAVCRGAHAADAGLGGGRIFWSSTARRTSWPAMC